MQVENYQTISKVLSKMVNNTSITTLYRSIEIGDRAIRACSEYGNLEVWLTEPTGLTNPSLINANAFIGVISSLNPKSDLILSQVDNQIRWVCGDAKGHWVLVVQDNPIPLIVHDTTAWWTPSKEFAKGLLLAGAACQATTVSIGLYGVLMEVKDDKIRMMSSNSNALACATLFKDSYNAPSVTMRPPVPSVLSTIIDLGGTVKLDVTPQGIFAIGDWLVAHLPLSSPLDHNLESVLLRYPDNNFLAKIDNGAIRKFLSRAKLLADKGQPVNVKFNISGGRMIMESRSLSSSSEEYFLSEGLDPTWEFASVEIAVDLLMTSMEHVKTATLDYLKDNILILRGVAPDFIHIIGGTVKDQKKKGKRS